LTQFSDLGLPERLVHKLDAMNLTDPTPIQREAIPVALGGGDVMGLAQTGTGKTMAFGLPLVKTLLDQAYKPAPKSVRALILAPTRELVRQISEALAPLTQRTPLKVQMVVGGASISAQVKRLSRGTDILVATPGRLLDLLDRQALTLNDAGFLVLDEADQMLDLGFVHALRKLAKLLPKERQTMLFSATMPKHMTEIAAEYLVEPVRIEVSPPGKPADKIDQVLYYVPKAEKAVTLKRDLESHPGARAIVFARTKHGAERLMKSLVADGFKADSIHGNKSQGQRDRALKSFKAGETDVLVATDVAARGIDIPGVERVYNFDIPNVPENYVHRIGRTGRAGADGKAVAYVSPDEMGMLKTIEKVMKFTIPVAGGQRPADVLEPVKNTQRKRRIRAKSKASETASEGVEAATIEAKPSGTKNSETKSRDAKPGQKPRKPRAKKRFDGRKDTREAGPTEGFEKPQTHSEKSEKPAHKKPRKGKDTRNKARGTHEPKREQASHQAPEARRETPASDKKPKHKRQNAKQRAKSWSKPDGSGNPRRRNKGGKPSHGGNAMPRRRPGGGTHAA